ncbi:MAG: ABC transporter ATP-binding protein [Anaerolineae bacterium]|nr:ABC transporter ATP-binding protein [Anaerolineae bacterium]
MKYLRRITSYLKPYRNWMLIAFGLIIIEALTQLIIPRLLQYVIDAGITPRVMRVIITGSLLMLGAAAIGAYATVQRAVYAARFSQSMAYDMRNDLFTRIQTLSFGNLDRIQTGNLITRVSNDVDQVRMFTSLGLMLIVRALVLVVGSVGFLIATNARLTLIVAVLFPLIGVVFYFVARIAQPLFKELQARLSILNTVTQENLAGAEVVRAFVQESHEIDRFDQANTSFTQQALKVNRLMATAFPLIFMFTSLGTLAALLLGGLQVINTTMTVGELVAFNNYLMTASFPILMLGMILSMMPAADASAERILEVLDTEPEVKEADHPRDPGQIAGRVTFENVSFHYNGSSDCEVLCDIDLEIDPGQRVALLGATGSGKSTLVNLIPRFYDASSGRVLIDGVDVRDLSETALRAQIGFAMQQTTLFSGTVAENIAYGRPDAPREEIIAAAKAAQAHDFITAMPEGYDSKVESRGANLSGGQKQRIAIARALLIDPAILVFDDSTSSVDMDTEFRIQEALEELMEDRTTFIIAQRISSVLNADKIVILDRGRITAQGTHRELIKSSPIYQDIYRSQLRDDALVQAPVSG